MQYVYTFHCEIFIGSGFM